MNKRLSLLRAAVAGLMGAAALTLALPVPAQGPASTPQPRHTADEIAKATPDGTFEVDAEQLRLLVGGALGKGTLNYKGKSYPFTVKSASVGGVGYTKVHATGKVYFLERLEDFAGTYSAVSAGAALGKGAGGSQFENNKGVFLSVSSKTEGIALNLGLGAVQIAFVK